MFLLKNVQKYRKIYKKLVKSYYENTEQKMRGLYGKEEKKTEDGIPLLSDACRKSDPGSSGTEVGSELWK